MVGAVSKFHSRFVVSPHGLIVYWWGAKTFIKLMSPLILAYPAEYGRRIIVEIAVSPWLSSQKPAKPVSRWFRKK